MDDQGVGVQEVGCLCVGELKKEFAAVDGIEKKPLLVCKRVDEG